MEIKKTRCLVHGDEIVIEELKAPRTFENQIILYAKGWYKKSDDVMDDLKTLLSEYIGQEASLNDVKSILCTCFGKYCPEHDRGEAIAEMLGWSWRSAFFEGRTPEQVMVGKLAIADGLYVDTDELLPVLEYSEEEKTPIHKERDVQREKMAAIPTGVTNE